MSFFRVKKMLDDLYVEYPDDMNGKEAIGDDIGLDSQEIVELKDLIEKSYGIRFANLNSSSTIGDISNEIQKKVTKNLDREDSLYKVITTCSALVDAPVNEVFHYIWNYENWSKYLPHVKETKTICEDAFFQEFYMTIKEEDKEEIRVRSIRRSISGQIIDFYQPIPPAGIEVHAGRWILSQSNQNRTQIVLIHKSIPDYETCKIKYHTSNKDEIDNIIRNWLQKHGKTTLQTWTKILA